MAQNEPTITGTSLTDDAQRLHLTIRVHSTSNRTLHLYNSVRALRYDAATKTLEVQLSDHGLVEPRELRFGDEQLPATFILPSFTTVDANSDTELALSLPRTIVRPDMAKSTTASMKFESLPIHEAAAVKVLLAWSDTPYYEDPRMPYDHRQQLVNWAKGVATHQSARNAASPPEKSPQDLDRNKGKNRDRDVDKDKKQNTDKN
jgi:hypothetical protein